MDSSFSFNVRRKWLIFIFDAFWKSFFRKRRSFNFWSIHSAMITLIYQWKSLILKIMFILKLIKRWNSPSKLTEKLRQISWWVYYEMLKYRGSWDFIIFQKIFIEINLNHYLTKKNLLKNREISIDRKSDESHENQILWQSMFLRFFDSEEFVYWNTIFTGWSVEIYLK